MVSPNSSEFQKRVGRYFKLRPRLVTVHDMQKPQPSVRVEKVFYGDHLVNATSNLQSTASLSSGEAEYYACVQGAALALGIRSVLQDWGLDARVELAADSIAAKGLASRRGVGRVRHVATRYLWLKE